MWLEGFNQKQNMAEEIMLLNLKHLNSVLFKIQRAGAQRRSSRKTHTIVLILFALCDHEQGVHANSVKTENTGY